MGWIGVSGVFVLWVLPKHDSFKRRVPFFIFITTSCVALFLYQDWQPPFACDVRNFRFTPRIQRLNELEVSLSGGWWWWLRRWSPPFMNHPVYILAWISEFWIFPSGPHSCQAELSGSNCKVLGTAGVEDSIPSRGKKDFGPLSTQ